MVKPKRRIMREFKIDEISGVDNPAQVEAKAILMKRFDKRVPEPQAGESREDYISRVMSDPLALSEYPDEDQRLAVANSVYAEKDVTDTQGMDLSRKDVTDTTGLDLWSARKSNEELLKAINQLTGLLSAPNTQAANSGEEKPKMDPAVNTADQRVKELESQLAVAKAVSDMSDVQKSHFRGLSDAGKLEFIALTPERRAAVADAALQADAVVYKATDGTEFRKSDNSRLVDLAKRNDEMAKQLAAAQAARENDRLEKSAGELMKNLPGEPVVKATLLRAIEGIGDEKLRNGALDIMRAGQAAIEKGFQNFGVAFSPEATNATAKLDSLAKARASADKIDYTAAYMKVLESDEGRLLYAETTKKS